MIRCRLNLLAALGIGLLGALLGACRSDPAGMDLAVVQRQIQSRVTNQIPEVVLFKPASNDAELPLIVQLAPLLIQAVTASNAPALWQDQPAPTSGPPQIQARKDIVLIKNRWHWQYTYTWRYPAGAPPVQGVRLTLDSRDLPAIWEVLADTSRQKVLYVSQTWEQTARQEFGLPLSGRKFSIERDRSETPDVVVANVIEDGPMAMGPILYLQSASHDVLALICRCMPAQFQSLHDQKDYELLLPGVEDRSSSPFSPVQLESLLRLPGSF